MDKVKIIYDNKLQCITFKRDELIISTILVSYDDALKLIDFQDGLLTILMRKGEEQIEEYVDFSYALGVLHMAKMRPKYFNGVSVEDMILEKAV